jgi:hypothetical protein
MDKEPNITLNLHIEDDNSITWNVHLSRSLKFNEEALKNLEEQINLFRDMLPNFVKGVEDLYKETN